MLEKYALFKVFIYLRNTKHEESVRSLSRKADVGVATSKRCLDYLFEKNIVKRKVIGKTHQYKLNTENVVTRQFKISMSLSEITDAKIVEEITSKFSTIYAIILYGSVAKGTDAANSDIDILIISGKDQKISQIKAEKYLKREVSIIVRSYEAWRRIAKKDKAFYDAIITEGIVLHGELPMVK